jgi:esterase/lipase
MRQMEVTKKEYIDKLKRELENVEERYLNTINQNCMVGEDYRSTAFKNLELIKNFTVTVKAREDELVNRDSTIIGINIQI